MIDLRPRYRELTPDDFYQPQRNPTANLLQALQQGYASGKIEKKAEEKKLAAAKFSTDHPEYAGIVNEDNIDAIAPHYVSAIAGVQKEQQRESAAQKNELMKEQARAALEEQRQKGADARFQAMTEASNKRLEAQMNMWDKRLENQNKNMEQNRLARMGTSQANLDLRGNLWGLGNLFKSQVLGDEPQPESITQNFQNLGGQLPPTATTGNKPSIKVRNFKITKK